MRAGLIEKPETAYCTEIEEPQITKPTDVKIQIKVTGICGSEVHAYHGKHPFRIPPVVSGHEFAGVVVEIGSAVTACKVGDRVTAEPQYGCGVCPACRSGRYNICRDKRVLGSNGWSGSFGEFIVVPQSTVVHLKDNVSFEQGALIEPIAVGMHAVRQHHVGIDTSVLIIGAGTIGLGLLLSAKACGPKCIIAADVVDYNLDAAKKMGADATFNTKRDNLADRVMKLTEGQGVDICFLAFGNADAVETAALCTKRGGTISEIALMPNGTGAPFALIQNKELNLAGSNMYVRDDYLAVVNCMDRGLMDTKLMITQNYSIEEMTQAMRMADLRPEPVIKVMLHF